MRPYYHNVTLQPITRFCSLKAALLRFGFLYVTDKMQLENFH